MKVDGNVVEIHTDPGDMEEVRKSLEGSGVTISSAELTRIPQNLVSLGEKEAVQTLKLLDKLEEIDGVQHVFTNADFTEEAMESYRAG